VKLVLEHDDYLNTLKQIRDINSDLEQITMQRTKKPPPPMPTKQSPATENYNRIRSHAMNLYAVFQEKFRSAQCLCSHNASLRLENHRDQDELRLKVLIDYKYVPATNTPLPRNWAQQNWLALEFEPVQRQNTGSQSNHGEGLHAHKSEDSPSPTPSKESSGRWKEFREMARGLKINVKDTIR